MAKIYVAGNAVCFESSMKLDDLVQVKKYRPKALAVMGGDDGKEMEFICAVIPGAVGEVTRSGVVFGMASVDKKLATVTMMLGSDAYDAQTLKEYLADKFGAALNYMNKLEAELPNVLKEVEAERAAVMQSIQIGACEPESDVAEEA